jgi:hypothetical protein
MQFITMNTPSYTHIASKWGNIRVDVLNHERLGSINSPLTKKWAAMFLTLLTKLENWFLLFTCPSKILILSYLIYKCKEMLHPNPKKNLRFVHGFFTKMHLHGRQNARPWHWWYPAIKQCHYQSFLYENHYANLIIIRIFDAFLSNHKKILLV